MVKCSMKKLLFALVFLFTFSLPAAGIPPRIVVDSPQDQKFYAALRTVHSVAWRMACEIKRIDCSVHVPPFIGYTLLSGRFGQYMPGERVVLVDFSLLGEPFSLTVMVHETIHYLQWAGGERNPEVPAKFLTHCASEEEAFRLTWEANRRWNMVDATKEPRLRTWEAARPYYVGCWGAGRIR